MEENRVLEPNVEEALRIGNESVQGFDAIVQKCNEETTEEIRKAMDLLSAEQTAYLKMLEDPTLSFQQKKMIVKEINNVDDKASKLIKNSDDVRNERINKSGIMRFFTFAGISSLIGAGFYEIVKNPELIKRATKALMGAV